MLKVAESVYQLKMNIWRKFDCPAELVEVIRRKHYEAVMEIAFTAVDYKVAADALKKIKELGHRPGIRLYLLYLGSINKHANNLMRRLILSRSRIRKILAG